MNDELSRVAARALFACLKITTGLPVRQTGNGAEIKIDDNWCFCEATFDHIAEAGDGIMAAAKVSIAVTKHAVVEDVIVGSGDSVGEAALTVIQQFVGGIVMPIASLYNNLPGPHRGHGDQATISTMKFQGVDWTVAIGDVTSNDATGALYDVVDLDPPVDMVWSAIQSRMPKSGPHWAKIYLCRYPDGVIDGEVRIDNELDDIAFQTLKAFVWPTEQEMIWFRQFCYLEPTGHRQDYAQVRHPNPFKWINPFSR